MKVLSLIIWVALTGSAGTAAIASTRDPVDTAAGSQMSAGAATGTSQIE